MRSAKTLLFGPAPDFRLLDIKNLYPVKIQGLQELIVLKAGVFIA